MKPRLFLPLIAAIMALAAFLTACENLPDPITGETGTTPPETTESPDYTTPAESSETTGFTNPAEPVIAVTDVIDGDDDGEVIGNGGDTLPTGYSAEFFDNTLFIGDSIFTGLTGYGFFPAENVFAKIGLNPESIMNVEIDGQTAVGKAKSGGFERIVIMLGTNGLAFINEERLASDIEIFIKEVKDECPDAEIILLTVPPITAVCESGGDIKMSDINAYNEKLSDKAEVCGITFIDICTPLKNESGYFKEEYAEADGMHFKTSAYKAVLGLIESGVS